MADNQQHEEIQTKCSDRLDGQLLAEVGSAASEDSFEELLRRHGAMVLETCRRMLNSEADADDAAQAVFLILWKKASGLRGRASVAAWLHRVARNVCRNSIRRRDVRMHREREAAEMQQHSQGDDQWDDIKDVLDDELDRLPDKLRLPLILFHLEGRTLREIEVLSGVNASTIGTRLYKAREVLRSRLSRHGVTIGAAAVAATLTNKATAAATPAAFVSTASRAAVLFSAAQGATEGVIATPSVLLAKGALHTMFASKVKLVSVAILASTVGVSAGIGLLPLAAGPTGEDQQSNFQQQPESRDQLTISGQVLTPNGQPAQQAKVGLIVSRDTRGGYSHPTSFEVARGLSDHRGAFEMTLDRSSLQGAMGITVFAIHPGSALWWKNLDHLEIDLTEFDGKIELADHTPVAGTVVDSNGKPISGAEVMVSAAVIGRADPARPHIYNAVIFSSGNDATRPVSVKTDRTGNFLLGGLTRDVAVASIVAHHSDYAPREMYFSPSKAESPKVVLGLRSSDVLNGKLLAADGRPAARVPIAVVSHNLVGRGQALQFAGVSTGTTDANGLFRVTPYEADRYEVGLSLAPEKYVRLIAPASRQAVIGKELLLRLPDGLVTSSGNETD